MGHSVITCGNCDNYIMEGRNDWDCDECGWHMDCSQYPHGTMKLSKDYRKGSEMTIGTMRSDYLKLLVHRIRNAGPDEWHQYTKEEGWDALEELLKIIEES